MEMPGVEVVIALAAVVLLVLVTIVVAARSGMRVQEGMKARLAETHAGWIRAALDAYYEDHGRYPDGTAEEMLLTLMGRDDPGQKVYLAAPLMMRKGRPVDAWGRAFRLSPTLPGERPVIGKSDQ